MRHPTEGAVRRLLDDPAGVSDADRRHVVDCPECLDELASARADADLVDAALATESDADLDVAAAWRRLSTAPTTSSASGATAAIPSGQASRPRAARSRAALRRPLVAALAVGVVLAGAGTAAANDWLQVFRTERVAPVSIAPGDLVALPDLSAYGELRMTAQPDVREVADAQEAAELTGLEVPEVTELPRGVSGRPLLQVGDEVSATFTFSRERAAEAAAEAGEALPPPPPGLNGSSVRMDAGPGVVQTWSSDAGAPALVVARAVAPTAFSSGAPFETVRDYLLSLPGLPDDVAAQLRTFTADGSTLPLPVPADEVTTSSAEVGGTPATVLQTRDRTLAAVVWVDDGTVTAVAGSLDDDELLDLARDLS
jgi:hypothetical protein